MTKRCICEICTCGRHRCPHRPHNLVGHGEGPCNLTEYNTTYKNHPIPKRESFKPNQQPLSGGEFEDRTTQRQDYRKHPLERPHVHQHETYQTPQGDIDTTTSYNKEFTAKHGVPAKAIRNEGPRQVPARFEGEPTYRADYKKWDTGRQPAYGGQPAWQPPQSTFGGKTTFQQDYKPYEQQPRQSFKPNEAAKASDTPFESRTSHGDAYTKHAIPPKFQRTREHYNPSGAPFDADTTFKSDYKGAPGGRMQSFKPDGTAFQSDAPFEDDTTNRVDYKRWQTERPYHHAPETYKKPEGDMEMATTNNMTYRRMPLEKQRPIRPVSANRGKDIPFDDTTSYGANYKKWTTDRVQPMRQPDYAPNNAPFEGNSTYKGAYIPHAAGHTKSFRPDNAPIMSDTKFEDGTMYSQDYTKKSIPLCEAAYIDQPTSRFQYAELSSQGHKLYAPVHTTITPLGPNRIQSPQRLQALSIA